MDNEKTIEVLNSLIVINNDRIEGYETASKETEAGDLKSLFSDFQQTSFTCKSELVAEVNRLGGTPDEGTRVTGKFFRVWMDVKAALTGNDRKLILDSCEYGEDVALEAYENALTKDGISTNSGAKDMLSKHHTALKADHDKVKQMRDASKQEKETM
ncbi:PA2169 family four-helix-bundle protein [Flavobacterium sp.]|uniref:ferritin-like domain-containing protein n=1 Tax=Flavobacterium sp. TaxID=239 RepID=UPI00286B7292|nr:PA2169 family four-helix-bundle protein [Flavobacterium sp.]